MEARLKLIKKISGEKKKTSPKQKNTPKKAKPRSQGPKP